MTIDAINRLLETRPFQPFRMHLASGKSVAVKSPEFVARYTGGRTVVVFEGPDDFQIMDLLLVERVEPLKRNMRKAS